VASAEPGPAGLTMMPGWHLTAGAKQLVEPVDQGQVVEVCIDLGGRQDFHELKGSGATRALWRSIAFCSLGCG
jgi:hypothetical protein